MSETRIEWTDATWNPVAGCSVLTTGCTHCYAMAMAKRLEAMGVEKYAGLTRRSGKRIVWNGVVKEDIKALYFRGIGEESAHKTAMANSSFVVTSTSLGIVGT